MKIELNKRTLELCITTDDGCEYNIDLERCNNSSELLDWILHINAKTWCTPEILKGVIDVLEDAAHDYFKIDLQGLYCPFGSNKEVIWKSVL